MAIQVERTPKDEARLRQRALARTLAELQECRRFEDDWDGEGAAAVSTEAVTRARALVRAIARAREGSTSEWIPPEVGPSRDGGIGLSWAKGNRRAHLRIPAHDPIITSITREVGEAPQRRIETPDDAVNTALWVLAG
jgi:hypothetical protein